MIVEELGKLGKTFKKELSACEHFLVDTEIKMKKKKNFQMNMIKKIIKEKYDEVFNKPKSAPCQCWSEVCSSNF